MKLTLYTTSDENNKLKKQLFNAQQFQGTLRNECSVLSPVIEIEITGAVPFNYAYIEEFNRYYYITDIVSVNLDLWRISLRVDVLMSYASDILSLEAIIKRNKNDFNLLIDDNSLNRYADERVQCYNFPRSLTTMGSQFKYYLALIGGGDNGN